jgi:hypothetical protein
MRFVGGDVEAAAVDHGGAEHREHEKRDENRQDRFHCRLPVLGVVRLRLIGGPFALGLR